MTYHGYEVLDWVKPINNVQQDVDGKYNLIGEIYQKRELYVQYKNYNRLSFTFALDSLEERHRFREFFKSVKGGHGKFFMPSFKNEYKLYAPINSGESKIYTEYGYEDLLADGRKSFLYIQGEDAPFMILGATKKYDESVNKMYTEILLERAVSNDYPKDCAVIYKLYLGRWDTDTLTISVDDINNSTASLKFRELAVEEIDAEVASWQ